MFAKYIHIEIFYNGAPWKMPFRQFFPIIIYRTLIEWPSMRR